MAEAARERGGDVPRLRPAVAREPLVLRPRRVRPPELRRIEVVPRDGVVEEVDVAAADHPHLLEVRVVDIERHQRAELLLESDRHLQPVRIAVIRRDDRRLLRRCRHRTRHDLFECDAARRVRHGETLVRGEERRCDRVVVELLAIRDIADGEVEQHPRAAADDQVVPAAHVVGESAARAEVELIARACLVAEVAAIDAVVLENRHVVNAGRIETGPVEVVPEAHVDRKVVGRAPVVAEPRRVIRTRHVDEKVLVVEDVELLQERQERVDLPRGRVVP